MSLKLTILGYHSATPRINAFPTAQILEIKNHTFLIDCGEGTQIQLRKFKISFAKINHIFISHLTWRPFFWVNRSFVQFWIIESYQTYEYLCPNWSERNH